MNNLLITVVATTGTDVNRVMATFDKNSAISNFLEYSEKYESVIISITNTGMANTHSFGGGLDWDDVNESFTIWFAKTCELLSK